MSTPLRKILSIVITVIIAIILLLKVFVYFGDGEKATIKSYFSALQANDLNKAYSYTSKEFQGVTTLRDFKEFVDQYPALHHDKNIKINKRDTEDGVQVVYLTLSGDKGEGVPIEVQLVKEKNKWKISYIEILNAGVAANRPAPAFNAEVLDNKAAANTVAIIPDLSHFYDNKPAGYSIKYPGSWEYTKPDDGTIVFSGKKGGNDYYSTVNIQVVNATDEDKTISTKEAVTHFSDELKKQFTEGKFSDDKPFYVYTSSGQQLQGESFNVVYTYKESNFKQWQIVVFRPNVALFYAFAYTAPPEIYDTYLPIAKDMLKTWVFF